eukprot:11171269-Lingulodinium_polyedra.AAC.1
MVSVHEACDLRRQVWMLFGCCFGAAWVLLGCCFGAALVLLGHCLRAARELLRVLLGCCLGAATTARKSHASRNTTTNGVRTGRT